MNWSILFRNEIAERLPGQLAGRARCRHSLPLIRQCHTWKLSLKINRSKTCCSKKDASYGIVESETKTEHPKQEALESKGRKVLIIAPGRAVNQGYAG